MLQEPRDRHRRPSAHTLEIESRDEGDFLVPRKAIELVENIRRATRSAEVRVDFLEHQAVFHVGPFDVSARLETEKFPAWEEVLAKQSKYELRVEKKAALEALDRIAAVMNARGHGVCLRRVGEGLEIHGKKPDAGELTITIPASDAAKFCEQCAAPLGRKCASCGMPARARPAVPRPASSSRCSRGSRRARRRAMPTRFPLSRVRSSQSSPVSSRR
jgi:hypothetical protein